MTDCGIPRPAAVTPASIEADEIDARKYLAAAIAGAAKVAEEMFRRLLAEGDRLKPETDTFITGFHFALQTMEGCCCLLALQHPVPFLPMLVRPYAERALQLWWVAMTPNGHERFLSHWNEQNAEWARKGLAHVGPLPAYATMQTLSASNVSPGLAPMPGKLKAVMAQIYKAYRRRGEAIPGNHHEREYRLTIAELNDGIHAHHGLLTHFLRGEPNGDRLRSHATTLVHIPTVWMARAACEYMQWDFAPYGDRLFPRRATAGSPSHL